MKFTTFLLYVGIIVVSYVISYFITEWYETQKLEKMKAKAANP
jgi:hypothetical protein